MNSFWPALFVFFALLSCSSTNSNNLKSDLIHKEEKYSYTDKNGQFLFRSASGFQKKDKSFFTKQSLEMITKNKDNAIEQVVSFSVLGAIKKKRMLLRPKNSEYHVWFDGKKFTSKLRIIPSKKSVELTTESPEPKWNGVKLFKFPNTKTATCFFSQVVECAKVMGLLKSAQKMNFYILWEGYPFLNETFTDFPTELFSKGELEYEGKQKNDEKKFSLHVAGQSIVYLLDKNNKLKKMFWVSQGISMINRSGKGAVPSDENVVEDSNE
jgi:hypothetical protein